MPLLREVFARGRLHAIFDLGQLHNVFVHGGVLGGVGGVAIQRIGVVGRHIRPQFLSAPTAEGERTRNADRADRIEFVRVEQHFRFQRFRRRP